MRARLDDRGATNLAELEFLFVETAEGVREFRLCHADPVSAGAFRITLEGVDDVTAAQALRGCAVMVDAAKLPPLREGEFYYFQLFGAEVMLSNGQRLGTIEEIFPTGANDVWVVREGSREVLVPVIADVVKAIDLDGRRVTIEPLPGMLD
jgi:16S rRNA processing protein RimM